jgi:hypothetical protein
MKRVIISHPEPCKLLNTSVNEEIIISNARANIRMEAVMNIILFLS